MRTPSKVHKGCIPSIHDRDDAGLPLSNLHERRLGHVEVGSRGVAPPAGVGVLGPVRRAEVGGGHRRERDPFEAPGRLDALDLVALPARVAVVEQSRAQSGRVRPVAGLEQVSISASSPYT